MKKVIAATALAALLAAAPSARAADDSGFVLGARAAYGFPLGNFGGLDDQDFDDAFDELVDDAYPLWLELNYRLTPSFEIGVYGQYAFINLGNDFGGDDGSDLRLGVQLNYIFASESMLSPWLGVGAGWEWLRGDADFPTSFGQAQQAVDTSLDGWDVMVQGGLDFQVANRFTLGPFAAVTFGQFGDIEIDDESTNIDDKAWHEWVQVGVRATFF